MAFPQDPLDVRTEVQIGGAWSDESQGVYLRDPITITRGRADEASRPDLSKATITFNNRLGKYSPKNPMSPYYGLIGRNTPVRVSVPAGGVHLALDGSAGSYATTPDATALHITGDIDVRAEVTANWRGANQVILGRWGTTGADRSWQILIYAGNIEFDWVDNATGSVGFLSGAAPDAMPAHAAVRATLDVNNGAGGLTATLYWAPTLDGPWTQFQTYTAAGTIALRSGAAPLQVGLTDTFTAINSPPFTGYAYRAEVRSGINGTVVAAPDFTARTVGTTSFTDSAGRIWSTHGTAEITDRRYRFTGEISSWPPKWDVSGKDRYVPVEAAGVLRRYGAGTSPLQSTLRRRIPSGKPLAYIPFEDGVATTQAASALTGGTPASLSGATWAADNTLPGSDALPTIGATSSLSVQVPPPKGSVTGWHLEFVFKIDTWPTADTPFIRLVFTSGPVREWQVNAVAGGSFGFQYVGVDGDGVTFTGGLTALPKSGVWNRFKMWSQQDGANVDVTVGYTEISGTGSFSTATYAGTVAPVRTVYCPYGSTGSGLEGMSLGHLAVLPTPGTTIFDFADKGFDGEQAHDRIRRLCTEQNVPVTFPYGTGPSAAMGPQRPAPFLDLLGECADADMGVQYEYRDTNELAYRPHWSFRNQPVGLALDYAADGEVAPPLEPVDDDAFTHNDITVGRVNGSSAHLTQDTGPMSVQLPPDGVGPVPGGGTLNVHSDTQLPNIAGWQLHLGTCEDGRYPSVHVDLAAAPHLIEDATALDVGDRLTIAHPPPEAGGIGDVLDLLGQGFVETLGLYDWDLTVNCTPGRPWLTGVTGVGDGSGPRAGTTQSALAADVTATATLLSVATLQGARWTSDPAQTPWDIRVGGEVITVTTVGQILNANPYFEANANGWTGNSAVLAWNPGRVYPGRGALASLQITPNGSSASGGASCAQSGPGSVTPGTVYTASAWAFCSSGLSDARMSIDWYDASGTLLSSGGLAGTTILPPALWVPLRQDLTAPASASQAVLRARHGGTPPATSVWNIWAARLVPTAAAAASPQPMTVTRSVNGIVKVQTAGTDIRLAQRIHAAL